MHKIIENNLKLMPDKSLFIDTCFHDYLMIYNFEDGVGHCRDFFDFGLEVSEIMKTVTFIAVEPAGYENSIANGIKNICELQLDCNYKEQYLKEGVGAPVIYKVKVTVEEIEPL